LTVDQVFETCRIERRAALIPYLMAGDPDLASTPGLMRAAADGGADIIELGIPYSDPLADGPTIQAAAQRALGAGTTLDGVLAMLASTARGRMRAPVLAFTYYNPIFVRGLDRSATDFARAGFAGAIIPDLPPEEAGAAAAAFAKAGIGLTFLVAPTTPLDRVREIDALSSGFVYVVSRMGVTGASQSPIASIGVLVSRLRPLVTHPLAVGFGISTPEQAAGIATLADGVVVGSGLIDRMAAAGAENKEAAVRDYCASLGAAMHKRL